MADFPIRVSVQLSQEDYEALARLADEHERPVAWVIRAAVKAYLEGSTKRQR